MATVDSTMTEVSAARSHANQLGRLKNEGGMVVTVDAQRRLVGAYATLMKVDSLAYVLIEALRADDDRVHHRFQVETIRDMVESVYTVLDGTGFSSPVRGTPDTDDVAPTINDIPRLDDEDRDALVGDAPEAENGLQRFMMQALLKVWQGLSHQARCKLIDVGTGWAAAPANDECSIARGDIPAGDEPATSQRDAQLQQLMGLWPQLSPSGKGEVFGYALAMAYPRPAAAHEPESDTDAGPKDAVTGNEPADTVESVLNEIDEAASLGIGMARDALNEFLRQSGEPSPTLQLIRDSLFEYTHKVDDLCGKARELLS